MMLTQRIGKQRQRVPDRRGRQRRGRCCLLGKDLNPFRDIAAGRCCTATPSCACPAPATPQTRERLQQLIKQYERDAHATASAILRQPAGRWSQRARRRPTIVRRQRTAAPAACDDVAARADRAHRLRLSAAAGAARPRRAAAGRRRWPAAPVRARPAAARAEAEAQRARGRAPGAGGQARQRRRTRPPFCG
ncbi:MAG: hypothetical protein MZW92_77700 [Comamonadaceae bacterium]|nr:hypothetical protein [Comamonadaceae bacterium]